MQTMSPCSGASAHKSHAAVGAHGRDHSEQCDPERLQSTDTINATCVGAEVLVVGGSGRLVRHALSHVPSHCCNALMVLVASVLSDVFGICAVLCVI